MGAKNSSQFMAPAKKNNGAKNQNEEMTKLKVKILQKKKRILNSKRAVCRLSAGTWRLADYYSNMSCGSSLTIVLWWCWRMKNKIKFLTFCQSDCAFFSVSAKEVTPATTSSKKYQLGLTLFCFLCANSGI